MLFRVRDRDTESQREYFHFFFYLFATTRAPARLVVLCFANKYPLMSLNSHTIPFTTPHDSLLLSILDFGLRRGSLRIVCRHRQQWAALAPVPLQRALLRRLRKTWILRAPFIHSVYKYFYENILHSTSRSINLPPLEEKKKRNSQSQRNNKKQNSRVPSIFLFNKYKSLLTLLILLTFQKGIPLMMSDFRLDQLHQHIVPPARLFLACSFDERWSIGRLYKNWIDMAGNLFSIGYLNHIRHVNAGLWYRFGLQTLGMRNEKESMRGGIIRNEWEKMSLK